jgi:hypothetical protein
MGTDEVLRMLLMYFVLPVWLAAGFADYLCSHRHLRPEQSDQCQPNHAANISHQPRALPNSTSLLAGLSFRQ